MKDVSLEDRVKDLETYRSRSRRLIGLCLMTTAAAFAIGQGRPGIIEAERFVVRAPGDPGPRAILGTTADGTLTLTFFRKDGKTAAGVGLRSTGGPAVELFDSAGTKRAAMGIDDKDQIPGFRLFDTKGDLRVATILKRAGGGLTVFADDGQPRAAIGTQFDAGAVRIWDDHGKLILARP